jgi:isoaspartyl peptidase/L-asparaginase-like protein (Ntn-hydrolase superfamily)
MTPAFALHGGAGVMRADEYPPHRREAIEEALKQIALAAWRALLSGKSALDVVEAAVAELEDCQYFNAGRGAVLNHAGHVELDAAIMDGRTRACGAVAGVHRPRNPVRAARVVMEKTQHVLLVGSAADKFLANAGVECAPARYFVTPERVAQWKAAAAEGRVSLDHDEEFRSRRKRVESVERHSGTVGAVARDRKGHLAAATSTGGMTNKLPGRAGDAPVIGAGTFADDHTCAVSGTGHGEYFIRSVLAHDVHARMAYGKLALGDAADAALADLDRRGGVGGLIAVGREGHAVLRFNSPGMYRAWIDSAGAARVGIFA